MKKTFFFIMCLFCSAFLIAQSQYGLRTINSHKYSNDAKFDVNDGGTIIVGGSSNPFLLKLNSSKAVVWSKNLTPSEFAYMGLMNKVIVCANGDYVAIGTYPVDGKKRGFACRVNPSNGAIIWSTASSNATFSTSSNGDWFENVVETQNGDIAIVGYTDLIDWTTDVNGLVVVLNGSTGNQIWTKICDGTYGVFFAGIDQLPNGDLIVAGSRWDPTAAPQRFAGLIVELDETTGAIQAQNSYEIPSYGIISPSGISYFITSLFALSCKSFSNGVVIQYYMLPGFGSPALPAVYVYDLTTRQISGNWFGHTDHDVDYNVVVYPLAIDDYIIAEADFDHVMVARWNNGYVYDREYNNSPRRINVFTSVDVHNSDMLLGGSTATTAGGFLGFTTTGFPLASGSCGVINNDNGITFAHELDPETDETTLSDADIMESLALDIEDDSTYLIDLCACPEDVTTNVNKCYTSNITLDAGSGSSYSWSPSTNLSAANVQSPTCTATSSTTYTVTITSGSCTYHKIFNVTVAGRADQTSTVNKCSSGSTLYNPMSLNATGGTAWAWTPSSGLSAYNVQNPVTTGNTTTTFSVTVTNSGATGCTNHDVFNLHVTHKPTLDGTTPVTICRGSNYTLDLTRASSGFTTYSYVWTSTPAGFSSTSQNPVVTPTVNTTYKVVVTGYPGSSPINCDATKNFVVNVQDCRTGIAQNEPVPAPHDIVMLNQNAPNPFGEKTEISYSIPENFAHATITFSNITGDVIKTEEIKQKGPGKITVYGKDINSGFYTYTLIVDGKILATKKMIRL